MIRSRFPLLVLAGALLFEVSMLPAQETPVAFVGAEIIPIRGEPIADGVLIVQGGKILAVGPRGTAVPAGATFREVKGQVILPGWIDTHSRIGSPAGGDTSAVSASSDALDRLNLARTPTSHSTMAPLLNTPRTAPRSLSRAWWQTHNHIKE